jgi:transcriptional regulator with XRE-family HTH domain
MTADSLRECGPEMRGARGAVAKLLQEQRERAGYSRAKLGELLGISPGTIEGWELGRVERPPVHDVIRLSEFLRISHDNLLAAVTADSGGVPPQQDDSSGVARKSRPKKAAGAAPLLEASFRLFGWKDDHDAATALNVSPDRVRRWRRRTEPMNVVDYLSLTALVTVGIAEAMRSADASDLDLRGAIESLGLRMAGA